VVAVVAVVLGTQEHLLAVAQAVLALSSFATQTHMQI
jgi:hypothetical protein